MESHFSIPYDIYYGSKALTDIDWEEQGIGISMYWKTYRCVMNGRHTPYLLHVRTVDGVVSHAAFCYGSGDHFRQCLRNGLSLTPGGKQDWIDDVKKHPQFYIMQIDL